MFFQWRPVYKVIKIEIFSKLLYFWKLCSKHTFTAESKCNRHPKKWPILIILCAFENLWPNLSNAHRIISIGQFFCMLIALWFCSKCVSGTKFPKIKQFWKYFDFDDFVNCPPLKKTFENQNVIKMWKSIRYIWFKVRLKA